MKWALHGRSRTASSSWTPAASSKRRRRSSSSEPRRRAARGHSSVRFSTEEHRTSCTPVDWTCRDIRHRRVDQHSLSTATTRGTKMTRFKTLRDTLASLGLLVTLTSLPSPAAAQDLPPVPQAIKDAGVVRIGVKCDSPPFGASGPDGKPVGIEVDMAKQIGVYAFGSPDKAELSCVATDARIPSLTGKKIDLILATLGKTPPREQVIDYSDIYYWGSSNVAVLKDSPIQSLADLKGKSILIVKAGNQIKWLPNHVLKFSSSSSIR